jgi:hypothetical protein
MMLTVVCGMGALVGAVYDGDGASEKNKKMKTFG